jgi:Mn2+/Fe2+ NRAMP family transporter
MVAILRVAASKKLMGKFVAPKPLRIAGWAATAVMAIAVAAMFWSLA